MRFPISYDRIAFPLIVYFLIASGGTYLPESNAFEIPNVHQAGDSILPPEPEEPPPEDGRSVYDPEIYSKWQGLPFTDVIPVEETPDEEDEGPMMPSYPWRGGGHEPMPLTDPEEEKQKTEAKEEEMLIGYIDCKKLNIDDDEDDDWGDFGDDIEKDEYEGSRENEVDIPDDESTDDSLEEDAEENLEGNEDSNAEKENFSLRKGLRFLGVSACSDLFEPPLTDANSLLYPTFHHVQQLCPSLLLINDYLFPPFANNKPTEILNPQTHKFHLDKMVNFKHIGFFKENYKKYKKSNYGNEENKPDVIRIGGPSNIKQRMYGNNLYNEQKEITSESTGFCSPKKYYGSMLSFEAGGHAYGPQEEILRPLIRPRIAQGRRAIRNYFLSEFRGVPNDDESKYSPGDSSDFDNVPDTQDGSSDAGPGSGGLHTELWDQSPQVPQFETQGQLTYEQCEQCLPCCAYFFKKEHDSAGVTHFSNDDECKPDDRDLDNPSAECRTCHVRRRPAGQGVTLTCYECAGQQGDRGCRLGPRNPEMSQYRVSARFFIISSSNETTSTATQANSMLARRPYFFVPQEGMESPIENEDEEGETEDFEEPDESEAKNLKDVKEMV